MSMIPRLKTSRHAEKTAVYTNDLTPSSLYPSAKTAIQSGMFRMRLTYPILKWNICCIIVAIPLSPAGANAFLNIKIS